LRIGLSAAGLALLGGAGSGCTAASYSEGHVGDGAYTSDKAASAASTDELVARILPKACALRVYPNPGPNRE